jgi:hypothetical protein
MPAASTVPQIPRRSMSAAGLARPAARSAQKFFLVTSGSHQARSTRQARALSRWPAWLSAVSWMPGALGSPSKSTSKAALVLRSSAATGGKEDRKVALGVVALQHQEAGGGLARVEERGGQ